MVMVVNKMMINKKRIEKILIVNLGGMGDLLLLTPFIREIRNLFPHVELSLLGINRSVPILKTNEKIDKIYSIDDIYIKKVENIFEMVSLLYKLRKERFDLVINTLPIARWGGSIKFLALLSVISPKISIGLNTDGRGFFYDLSIYEDGNKHLHSIDNYLQLVRFFGGKTDIRHLELTIPDNKENVDKILGPRFSEAGLLIGINPGATLQTRRWPKKRFGRLLKLLGDRYEGAFFIITGMKKEYGMGEDIIGLSGIDSNRVLNLCGKTSIMEFITLLKKITLFITNDTGSMHVAAAVDIPLVAIFGPGDLKRFYPVSLSGRVEIVRKKVECAPCVREYCEELSCLNIIGAEDVFKAANRLIMESSDYDKPNSK